MRLLVVCLLLFVTCFTFTGTACATHHHGEGGEKENGSGKTENSGGEKENGDVGNATDGEKATHKENEAAASLEEAPTATSPSKVSQLFKFRGSEAKTLQIVESATKYLTAQRVLPLLADTEHYSRKALHHAITQPFDKEYPGGDLNRVVNSLLFLISAIKAVREDVNNASRAWTQLKEAARNLAAHKQAHIGNKHEVAEALLQFLEAEIWMKASSSLAEYSTGLLKRVAKKEEVRKSINLVKDGAQSLATLLEYLSFGKN